MVPVMGGRYKVWTKRMGAGPLKVLLLHGGPGLRTSIWRRWNRFCRRPALRCTYYDQLGCGNSDKPTDAALWTRERYREEVEEVRAGLGLEDFVLSWAVVGRDAGNRVCAQVPATPARAGDFKYDGWHPGLPGAAGSLERAAEAGGAGDT